MANEVYAEQSRRRLAIRYTGETQVPVTISPFYAEQLGSNVPLSINGIAVYVKADGQTHWIPESYSHLLAQKLQRANTQKLRQGALGNISANFEHSAGELKFF